MLINFSISTNKFQNRSNQVSFKNGLTHDVVMRVKNMPSDEYKKITQHLFEKYDIKVDSSSSNVVAFCVEKTVEIMSRGGFSLPKSFEPIKLTRDMLGQYSYFPSKVSINSNQKAFFDLEQLNKMEKHQSPLGHFLTTYLHEFLHAAHFNNIMEKHCDDAIAFDSLSELRPYKILFKPMLLFIKKLCPDASKSQINKLFPEKKELFFEEDLVEYFAEKNAMIIAEKLGKNLSIDNIKYSFITNYKGFPDDWSLMGELKKINKHSTYYSDIRNIIKNNLEFFEGEIWNGNVDNIKAKSNAFIDFANNA